MASRLYLTDAASTIPFSGEQSSVLPVGTFSSFFSFIETLSTVPGSLENSIGGSSIAQVAHQDNFFNAFALGPLGGQIIPAQTWSFRIKCSEGDLNANSFLALSLYIYRPGTGVSAYIYDSDTPLSTEWSTTEAARTGTFSGASASAANNDYLILEVWRHAIQDVAAAYTQAIYYSGDPGDVGGTSFLDSPQTLNQQARRIYIV